MIKKIICVLIGILLILNGFIFGVLVEGASITFEEIIKINLCVLMFFGGIGLLATSLSDIFY